MKGITSSKALVSIQFITLIRFWFNTYFLLQLFYQTDRYIVIQNIFVSCRENEREALKGFTRHQLKEQSRVETSYDDSTDNNNLEVNIDLFLYNILTDLKSVFCHS